MDPRVAWIQPEQKGPANALWMQVWETSQGVRVFSPQQHHHHHHNQNQCVNYSALDVLKNVASSKSVCSGAAASQRNGSGHHIIMNGTASINGTAISSLGLSLSGGNANDPFAGAAEPGDGKALAHKPASFSSSSSSSQESGTESPPSGCPLERTTGGNVTGNVNKHAGAGAHFGSGDNIDNNHVNLYHHQPRHPQEQQQPAFTFQPIWMSRGQQVHPSPVPVSHTHSHHPGRRKSDNKASTYGMNYLLSNCTNVNYANAWTPWKARKYSPGLLG